MRQRDISRRATRSQRAEEEAQLSRRMNLSRELAEAALKRLQLALSDPKFVEKLIRKKLTTVPAGLMSESSPGTLHQIDATVRFLVAWKFFYPLLADEDIVRTADRLWPGLVSEVKDAFIAIIMDGPSQRTPP